MCFKKLFGGGGEPITFEGDLVALSGVINDYPGTANDLNGCINDQINAEKTLTSYWNNFIFHKLKDSQVTCSAWDKNLTEALKQHWDTVILFMDCCFAEDNTRGFVHDKRERFVKPAGLKRVKIIRRLGRTAEMKHIAFSACQDYQTSADAHIGGSYNGAFTYFAMKALRPSMTYRDWYLATKSLLSNSAFEQIPELQGMDELLNKKVFSDKTLFVQYSGHGTFTKDLNGDEADGQDEAMYLYDGIFLDDRLAKVLTAIH